MGVTMRSGWEGLVLLMTLLREGNWKFHTGAAVALPHASPPWADLYLSPFCVVNGEYKNV